MVKKYFMSSLGICLLILLSLLNIYLLYSLDLYLNLMPVISFFLILIIFLCIFLYFSRKILLFNIGIFIMFLCNVILVYNVLDIEDKYEYISNLFTREYVYEKYEVYTQKKTPIYSNIDKLSNKKMGLLKDNDEYVISYMGNVVNVEFISYESISDIENALLEGEIQCFIVPNYIMENTDNEIRDRVVPIYHSKIKYDKSDK